MVLSVGSKHQIEDAVPSALLCFDDSKLILPEQIIYISFGVFTPLLFSFSE